MWDVTFMIPFSSLSFVDCEQVNICCVATEITWQRLTTEHRENNILLKAGVRYFLSNFYFSPNDSPSKTMKHVF